LGRRCRSDEGQLSDEHPFGPDGLPAPAGTAIQLRGKLADERNRTTRRFFSGKLQSKADFGCREPETYDGTGLTDMGSTTVGERLDGATICNERVLRLFAGRQSPARQEADAGGKVYGASRRRVVQWEFGMAVCDRDPSYIGPRSLTGLSGRAGPWFQHRFRVVRRENAESRPVVKLTGCKS